MDVVVLSGGTGTEREVAISTGRMVCNALREKGHRAIILDVFFGMPGINIERIFEDVYDVEQVVTQLFSMSEKIEETKAVRKGYFGENVIEICEKADIVFLALHGENGENGKLQAVFDLYDIPYTGTGYLGSALAMDKHYARMILNANDIPIAKGITLTKDRNAVSPDYKVSMQEMSKYGLSLPCVVKPCCGGSSVGVYIAHTEEQFKKAVKDAFAYEDILIIEQYIKGREFSVAIIANHALPVIEIAPIEGFYDYTNKYVPGKAIETCPAELEQSIAERMQALALKAAEALSLTTYSRVDFLLDEADNIYCLEANTLPGMTPTSLLPQEAKAIGMGFPELCEKLIDISLKK